MICMADVELSVLERVRVSKEGMDEEQVLEIKKEWCEALEKLEGCLAPGSLKSDRIIYGSYLWHILGSPAAVDENYLILFSTPNREALFDYFPSKQSKLGTIAHEAFGHPADKQHYYPNDLSSFDNEYNEFVSLEQRANLHVVHLLPNAFYECTKELVNSGFRLLNINPDLGEYGEAFMAIEALGRAGLPRRDNVVEFFKEANDNRKISIDRYLEEYWMYALAGLAVPPSLNHETKYGVRTNDDSKKINSGLASYIRGETKKPPQIVTYAQDGYRPEYAVDLRWINLPKALEELNMSMSHWQNRFRRHNGLNYAQDMYESLQVMHDRIKKELDANAISIPRGR